MASEQAILEVLRGIKDPDSQKDIVSLGLVRDVTVRGGEVSLTLAFTGQPPATKVMIHSMASKLVAQLSGVTKASVNETSPPRTVTSRTRPRLTMSF